MVRLARELRDSGIQLDHIDIGGGLGISYDGSRVPTAAEYAAAVLPIVAPSGLSIALEPGRYIVGAAAALLARVVDLKDAAGGHHFAVLDAGMTELMRPMLYGSFHRIDAVTPRAAREVRYDIVGPVCESTDAFGAIGGSTRSKSATCWRSSMPARTARRWRRITTGARCRRRCWWMAGTRRLIRRRQTIDDQLALET